MRRQLILGFVLAAAHTILWLSAGHAAEVADDGTGLIASLLPSVVSIETKSLQAAAPVDAKSAAASNLKQSFGAGFVVDAEGYIATNRHVIDNAYDIIVTFSDNTRLAATVVGKGRGYDLALLKVNPIKPLQAARFGDSDRLQVGTPVLAIGNPYGLGTTVTSGIVGALNRDLHFTHYDEFIQTDAAINHGNSGGPLFNMQGEVVGITTALFSSVKDGGSVGLGFAIPATDARPLIRILRTYGYLRVGSLEVLPEPVTPEIADALGVPVKGVIVTKIDKGSPAVGKLQLGDIVLRINDQEFNDQRDFYRRVGRSLGETLDLTIWRDGKTLQVQVAAIQWPEEAKLPDTKADKPVAQQSESMRFGLEVAPITEENREMFGLETDQKGLVVTKVMPESAGAAAGFSIGDVIETVQMRPVSTVKDAQQRLEQAVSEHRKYVIGLIKGRREARFITLPLSAVGQ